MRSAWCRRRRARRHGGRAASGWSPGRRTVRLTTPPTGRRLRLRRLDAGRALGAVVEVAGNPVLRPHTGTDHLKAVELARCLEHGAVELVTTIGYYCLISLTLNAFEVPLPNEMQDPWPNEP